MKLTRTQISLSEDERSILDGVSRRTGRSMSALIRDAIVSTYGVPSTTDRLQAALNSTFGVVATDESGEAQVEAIRSGRRLAELA